MPTSSKSRAPSSRRSGRGGFTLIELLVAVSIIAIISAVVFANYRRYDSAVILQNKAYQVALAIREAQSRSISVGVLGTELAATGDGYGIRFHRTAPNNAGYQFCVYPASTLPSNGICEPLTPLGDGVTISDLHTGDVGNPGVTRRNPVNIKFVRPHLTAEIAANTENFNRNRGRVRVTLSGQHGLTTTVCAWKTGLVTVGTDDC